MKQALRLNLTILIGMTLAAAALAAPQAQSAPATPPAAAPATPAPAPPPPCTAPEFHQFDFWVGEWDLSWPGPGGSPGGTGTNRIEKILDGCVIQENFNGGGAQPIRGHSVSTYNPQTKKWQQTWVDSQGGYVDVAGEFQNGEMRLTRQGTGPDGKPRLMRMVFSNIKADSFDWRWEASPDGGKTWQLNWPIHYKRKGTP